MLLLTGRGVEDGILGADFVRKAHVDGRLALPVLLLDIIQHVNELGKQFLVGKHVPIIDISARHRGCGDDQGARRTNPQPLAENVGGNSSAMSILLRRGARWPEVVLRVKVLDSLAGELLQSIC